MTTTEFNTQLSSLSSALFANAMRLSCNKHNAQDLMQETTMRAFASCHKFTEGTNFKAWMYTIMQNCFINEYRKRRSRRSVVFMMEDNMQVVLQQPIKNMGHSTVMMKELRGILDELTEANRIPFELHFDGFGYQEIAEQLDVPLGTVKSRIFFARKKLKSMIQCQYGDQAQYA
ncbi:MAG: sigma-70 family RNA polymerase sigma factor [Saprospiraceae bacterium]|jgi:RNA polymerase sigma-70 factor (ECF subfamily)|nr:sigma-70 family RNA polymerase sigma factor [Saprospiraceae bacterium]